MYEIREKMILLRRGFRKFLTCFFIKKPNGVKVVNETWDYLIILDACRYDYFEKNYSEYLEGKLYKKISQGSYTPEWLERNFSDKNNDIVYVGGNDFVERDFKDRFHFVDNVANYAWDEKLGTVKPNDITKAALRNKIKFPNKRIIVHYVQPHAPFVGKERVKHLKFLDENKPAWRAFDMARMGLVSKEKLRKAYEENLKLVLKEVKELIKYIKGKIIVTADHGELLSEYGLYGHRRELYFKELIEVPWLVIKKMMLKKYQKNI